MSGLMPYEGLGIGVRCCHVVFDCSNQFRGALETSPPDSFLGEVAEPPLHQVQPGRTRRRKVQRETRVLLQPYLHPGLFVSPIVVHNQMQRRPLRKLPIQPPQEAQKLLVTVLGHALADNSPIQDIQCREQGGSTMPLVVVGHGSAASFFHGQARLGPLEGLDLTLFVHAQDDGFVRRIEVQPHHVGELLGEAPVTGELESLRPMGLQAMGGPDTLHGSLADALCPCHATSAPVSRTRRLRLSSGFHNPLHLLGGIRHRTASAGQNRGDSFGTTLQEALTPKDDGGTADARLSCDPDIGQTVSGKEGDLRPEGNALGRIMGANPGFQGASLLEGHWERTN